MVYSYRVQNIGFVSRARLRGGSGLPQDMRAPDSTSCRSTPKLYTSQWYDRGPVPLSIVVGHMYCSVPARVHSHDILFFTASFLQSACDRGTPQHIPTECNV